MLKKDGEYIVYKVEMLLYPNLGEDGWIEVGDYQVAKVPVEYRVLNLGKYDGKEKEPFHSFSCSGQCWQELGIHGFYDLNLATEFFNLISAYNSYKMRLVKVELKQTRIVLLIQFHHV